MTLRILPAGVIEAGVHHTFHDDTLDDVSASMGEFDEAGHSDFDFELRYGVTAGRVTDLDLTMRLTIDMPVWTRANRRPGAEQQEWNRFLRALRAHEDGHMDICRREAPTTHERLLRARPNTIDAVLEAERRRILRVNLAYDRRTDYGRSQSTPHGNTTIVIPPASP